MRGVRVVVRHAAHGVNRGIGYDLVLDGEPAGRLEASGERWLTVDPGPHSLFVNHERSPQGVTGAFVAESGVDISLWVVPVGLTYRLRLVEQADEPAPPVVTWRYALVMPAPATVTLVLLVFVHRVWPSDWVPNSAEAASLAMVLLFAMSVRVVAHAWRARVVALVTLFAVEFGTWWAGHGDLAVVLRVVAALWAASFTYAAATRELRPGRRRVGRAPSTSRGSRPPGTPPHRPGTP